MGWLSGWSCRKSITLSRASGAVTNYQMKLLVGESSGATGENVDCGGFCLSNFNDLRFTKADGTTPLDYWIESITGTTPNQLATIWIEFDSIGTDATTFYMYYGKADAAAASNGDNTFPFFDDFAGSAIDSDKWDTIGAPTKSVADGELDITQSASNVGLRSKTASFSAGNAICTRHKAYQLGAGKGMQAIGFGIYNETPVDWVGMAIYTSGSSTIFCGASTSAGWGDSGAFAGSTSYSILEIRWLTNSVKGYENGTQKGNEVTANVPSSSLKISIGTAVLASFTTVNRSIFDWIFVRQYVATEPAWGSWGSIEFMATPRGYNYLHARRDRMNMRPVSTQNSLE